MDGNVRCRFCGLAESEHHTFEPVDQPAPCHCDPGEWEGVIGEICDEYDGIGGVCSNCEHDQECHAERETP